MVEEDEERATENLENKNARSIGTVPRRIGEGYHYRIGIRKTQST
jgi:hypothetical protein